MLKLKLKLLISFLFLIPYGAISTVESNVDACVYNVFVDYCKTKFSSEGEKELYQVVTNLKKDSTIFVKIKVHSGFQDDKQGCSPTSSGARKIETYLVQNRISSFRFKVFALGMAEPLSINHKKNDRVEVIYSKMKQHNDK